MDLQKRLHSFPDDLEEFFQHMLDTIDHNYQQQTAQTFQVALEASKPLTLMTYFMLDELETNPGFALELEPRVMSEMDITSRHDDMKLRINARCKDLLEVTRVKNPYCYNTPADASNGSIVSQLPASFSDYHVDFLHRTVRDFLHIRRTNEWIQAHVCRGFSCDHSLSAAFLAQIKTTSLVLGTVSQFQAFSDLLINIAHHAVVLSPEGALRLPHFLTVSSESLRVTSNSILSLPTDVNMLPCHKFLNR